MTQSQQSQVQQWQTQQQQYPAQMPEIWRLLIVHRTVLSYPDTVTTSYNEVRMQPSDEPGQAVLSARLEIDPFEGVLSYIDYFGTRVSAFDIHRPHRHLAVTATTTVETFPPTESWPGAIPQAFPTNVTAVTQGDPVELLARAPDGALIAVMTHSHALDLDLVIAALQSDRFTYVGLIGSATKRARFTSAMQRMGMAADVVGKLVCPIGLTAIRDKAPVAIAASVAAQVLMIREQLQAITARDSQITSGQARHG